MGFNESTGLTRKPFRRPSQVSASLCETWGWLVWPAPRVCLGGGGAPRRKGAPGGIRPARAGHAPPAAGRCRGAYSLWAGGLPGRRCCRRPAAACLNGPLFGSAGSAGIYDTVTELERMWNFLQLLFWIAFTQEFNSAKTLAGARGTRPCRGPRPKRVGPANQVSAAGQSLIRRGAAPPMGPFGSAASARAVRPRAHAVRDPACRSQQARLWLF